MDKRVNGVMFGGKHSYYDYGLWLSERPDMGTPKAKTITVEIPGADGVLDLTESTTGEIKYSNRKCTLVFAAMVDITDQARFKSMLMDELHGKIMNVVLDEDSDWIYRGRLDVTIEDIQTWKLKVQVEIDAEPYKIALRDTEIDFSQSDSEPATNVKVADNVSTAPYKTVFRFSSPADFIRFDAIKLRWNPDTATTWGARHYAKFISADGDYHREQLTLADGYAEFSNSDMSGFSGVDMQNIIQVEIDNIGDGELTARINDAKIYPVYNERMSVVPRWMISGSGDITCFVNGRETVIPAGDSRNPAVLLKAGKNDIVIFDSVVDRVKMVFRKGRL